MTCVPNWEWRHKFDKSFIVVIRLNKTIWSNLRLIFELKSNEQKNRFNSTQMSIMTKILFVKPKGRIHGPSKPKPKPKSQKPLYNCNWISKTSITRWITRLNIINWTVFTQMNINFILNYFKSLNSKFCFQTVYLHPLRYFRELGS